jgi:hypothetical protein
VGAYVRALAALALVACGRLGFDARSGGGGGGTGDATNGDGAGTPPTPHALPFSIVEGSGIGDTTLEADGTHLVLVDNTPGKNGNLVIFREGDGTPSLFVYVSTDAGTTWMRHQLFPGNSTGLNVMGACQDSVTHAFHLIWVDCCSLDQYGRWKPTYTGGDITGFTLDKTFMFFDETNDTPGPRDITEVVDITGAHRLAFAATAPATANHGMIELGVTTQAAGVAPATENDWAFATNMTGIGQNDALLPNNYPTADNTTTFMISISSNLGGGANAPFAVLAGFPKDKKLLAWSIAPVGSGDFSIGPQQTLSTAFGAGTGSRLDASLSVANAPSGVALIAYAEAASSSAPGLHVATFDTTGAFARDGFPQPSTSAQARHAVIGADSQSRPVVLFADGAGAIVGTLAFGGAWLAPTTIAQLSTPSGAWSVTSPWRPGGIDTFGVYRDAGSALTTTFARIYWQ